MSLLFLIYILFMKVLEIVDERVTRMRGGRWWKRKKWRLLLWRWQSLWPSVWTCYVRFIGSWFSLQIFMFPLPWRVKRIKLSFIFASLKKVASKCPWTCPSRVYGRSRQPWHLHKSSREGDCQTDIRLKVKLKLCACVGVLCLCPDFSYKF